MSKLKSSLRNSFFLLLIFCLALCGCGSDSSLGSDGNGTAVENGSLTYVDRYSNVNIDGANSVTVSPDGKNVYVSAWNVDTVAWFYRY